VKPVGVIANPASGRDIRRLVTSADAAPVSDRISILVRMVRALDSIGVEQVAFMPDPYGIGGKVARELEGQLSTTSVETLALERAEANFRDSVRCARIMREMGCALIVVMGGDGTCRVVSKGCGDTPILPVSTGTNNVFPQFVEGTLLGLAAGALASGSVDADLCCERVPVLELHRQGGPVEDIALVDVAVVAADEIGSRAVWRADTVRELFLTRSRPSQIGLSAIGGWWTGTPAATDCGLYLELGASGEPVAAPIAPGLIDTVRIASSATLAGGESRRIRHDQGVVALDGEREIVLTGEEPLYVRFRLEGPRVVNLENTLEHAARRGLLRGSG